MKRFRKCIYKDNGFFQAFAPAIASAIHFTLYRMLVRLNISKLREWALGSPGALEDPVALLAWIQMSVYRSQYLPDDREARRNFAELEKIMFLPSERVMEYSASWTDEMNRLAANDDDLRNLGEVTMEQIFALIRFPIDLLIDETSDSFKFGGQSAGLDLSKMVFTQSILEAAEHVEIEMLKAGRLIPSPDYVPMPECRPCKVLAR